MKIIDPDIRPFVIHAENVMIQEKVKKGTDPVNSLRSFGGLSPRYLIAKAMHGEYLRIMNRRLKQRERKVVVVETPDKLPKVEELSPEFQEFLVLAEKILDKIEKDIEAYNADIRKDPIEELPLCSGE